MTSSRALVAAFDLGVNFFFVSADAHWPLYEGVRRGLTKLLKGSASRRREIVIAVVSYLHDPFFAQSGVFHEAARAIPGAASADVLVAGAATAANLDRLVSLNTMRKSRLYGARGLGASFHDRKSAVHVCNTNSLDISFIRYSASRPSARTDLLPFLRPDARTRVFNFKSMMSPVTAEAFHRLPEEERSWLPNICDYYRFVLSHPAMDGILCAPQTPSEIRQLATALEQRPLLSQEQDYMIRLAALTHPNGIQKPFMASSIDGAPRGRADHRSNP